MNQLDVARVEGLSEQDSGERWLKALAEAGVVRRPGEAPPLQAMSALFEAAWRLSEADATVAGLRVTDRLHLAAPPGAWLAIPGVYVLCIVLALFRDTFEERLQTFGALLGGVGLLAVGLLLWVGAATWSQRRLRLLRLRDAAALRATVAAQVAAARAALLAAPFVVRTGAGAYVAHVPALRAVEERLRRLGPDAAERAALAAERDALRAALALHRAQPPEVWTDEGLHTGVR